jgi:hypothetical protein
MKKILFTIISLFSLAGLQAQLQNIPAKQGLEMEYTIFPMGQVFPCTLRLDSISSDYLSIAWKNSTGRGGKYIMTRASLDSAGTAFWGPPQYGMDVTLDPDMVMLILSKKLWNELKQNKKVNYDGTVYIQKEASGKNQMVFDGKPADAIYLESENGLVRIWVLNNPHLPILLKVEKNPFGVDLQIERVK